jgi:twitching motility protein PilU
MTHICTQGFLDEILTTMINKKASDLYVTIGCPAIYRISDKLVKHSDRILNNDDVSQMISQLLTPVQIENFEKELEYNISIEWAKKTRFRLNFFHQQRSRGMVIREIKTTIPTIKELGLPSIYEDLILKKRGLILVSSPSGSGKSTTVAAMLNHRNINGTGHIITIEDPIEFVHTNINCIFTQREIGIDTFSYEIALKNGLRQKADVIFIGEIRDRETMEYAINFAKTGHLCIATLHANNSNQSILRMLSFFPEEMHKNIAVNLSQNIEAIISQKIVPNLFHSRSVVTEIMLNVGLIKSLIADVKIDEIRNMIEKNEGMGSITFDSSLYNMTKDNIISEEIAIDNAENPNQLKFLFAQNDQNSVLNKALNKSANKNSF